MKLSELNGNYKIISSPDTSVASNNNPLNIKVGGATQHWVDSGDAILSGAGTDGGTFLKFKDLATGYKAAGELLSTGGYINLTVDSAMKRWSNSGYGGEISPTISNKKISELSPDEKTMLIAHMAGRENVKNKPLSLSSLSPNQYSVIKPTAEGIEPITPVEPYDTTVDLEEAGIGIAKSVVKTGFGALELLQSGGQKFLSMITPGMSYEDVKAKTGIDLLESGDETNTKITAALQYTSRGQKISGFLTDVATFFIPGTGTAKGVLAIKGLKGLDFVGDVKKTKDLFTASNALKIAIKAAPDATIAASQAKGAGATDQEAIQTGFMTGLISGGLSAAGKVYKTKKAISVAEKAAVKPLGLFEKETAKEATGWLNKAIAGLTKKSLGATAKDIERGRVPSFDFIKTNKIAYGLGNRKAASENNIKVLAGQINDVLVTSGREVDKKLYTVIVGRARDLIRKDYELVTREGDINEMLLKALNKYAWKISDPLVKGKGPRVKVDELNKVRQVLDRVIKKSETEKIFQKGEEGVLKEIDVLRKIKQSIADVVKETNPKTKELFKKEQGWIQVRDLTDVAINKASAQWGIGMNDAVATGIGFMGGGAPGAFASLALKKAYQSQKTPLLLAFLLKKLPAEKTTELLTKIAAVSDDAPASAVKAIILNFIQDNLTEENAQEFMSDL